MPGLKTALLVALVASWTASAIHASDDWIAQSWLFDWDSPGVDPTVSIPQTAQCEIININWQRATGDVPDYVPPFYLRIYTSTYLAPLVIDAGSNLAYNFTVPFAPGTQYQICMVDSKGNSGGCQASYTVYPNNTLTLDPKTNQTVAVAPVCANVTLPSPSQLINVTGVDVNGPLTRMAWADQCTDISLRPTNGTPPYTLTVAPTYHPPLNMTFPTAAAINWTVTLGWAHQFYLSLVDANGASWQTGPLHAGGNGFTNCLVLGGNSLGVRATLPSSSSQKLSAGALGGAIAGTLIVGMLLGVFISWCFRRRPRRASFHKQKSIVSDVEPYPLTLGSHTVTSRPTTEVGDTLSRAESPRTVAGALSSQMSPQLGRQTSDGSSHQVYVVHHDGGRPPISVYHPEGANVVELPPTYGPRSPVDRLTEEQPQPRQRYGHQALQKMRLASSDSSTGSV